MTFRQVFEFVIFEEEGSFLVYIYQALKENNIIVAKKSLQCSAAFEHVSMTELISALQVLLPQFNKWCELR